MSEVDTHVVLTKLPNDIKVLTTFLGRLLLLRIKISPKLVCICSVLIVVRGKGEFLLVCTAE